ncbi:MAG: bifunctional hydroxymethylpyrimidine kinase/phosphomethylpyrimidine kinase [Rhodobacteraceae bacterium]|nr:bifunctional hydroxymethylpyrimidine kinase/phosphomethylpyrimidine kinase [Paracoccaceae bacterium]
MSILVLGALHHDVIVTAPRLPELDETLVGDGVAHALGGKGANAAVAAARMGARVAMAGAVGSDAAAAALLDGLDAAGVDRRAVRRLPGASGMSVAIVTAGGAYGAVIVSAANGAVTGAEAVPGPDTRWLMIQNEVPEAANMAAARTARAAGARVMLNAAPARPMADGLLAMADILVVNRGEAAALAGSDDPGAAAGRLLARGPGAVVVTLGAGGLVARAADGLAARLPAVPVAARSSHGAGDAFAGALAARLDAGEPFAAALAFAQGAAALHVSLPPPARSAATPGQVLALIAAARGP